MGPAGDKFLCNRDVGYGGRVRKERSDWSSPDTLCRALDLTGTIDPGNINVCKVGSSDFEISRLSPTGFARNDNGGC